MLEMCNLHVHIYVDHRHISNPLAPQDLWHDAWMMKASAWNANII